MTQRMKIDASMLERFVRISSYEECLHVLPDLTHEHYEGLRAHTLRLVGDSESLEIKACDGALGAEGDDARQGAKRP